MVELVGRDRGPRAVDRNGSGLEGENARLPRRTFREARTIFLWDRPRHRHRQVKPDRERKSVGAEDTFAEDIHSYELAREGLQPLIEKVWGYCDANEIGAKTVTLKVKYADFSQITRSKTTPGTLSAITDLEEVVAQLLVPLFPPRKGIRLLGVSLSSLERRWSDTAPQLRLAL